MINPLDKLKKLKGRSVREIRVRGGQAITAYSEQLGLSGKLPTDAEFLSLLDRERTGGELSSEDLLANFGAWGDVRFFPSFADRETSIIAFRKIFGTNSEAKIIARAEQILTGKFDLLGFPALDFGVPVDWHLEPISGKRAALKHWKSFDEADSSETGDKKIVWELNRHQHFFTLGAAYWLTGDERFAAAFAMQISGWMRQNPPQTGINWMSSLEVAFRVVSWLWAIHFFKHSPSFAPTVFRDAMKFLYLHGRHIETYLSTFYSPNTHLTGEALGLYYLGTLAPELKRAAHWRRLGSRILLGELDRQILPDGVYFERTTWYQRYTTDFYTHFFILSRLNKAEFAPEEIKRLETKLQLALDFLMHATRPDGTTALIGDDDGGRMLPLGTCGGAANDFRATLATGAVLFERGDYKFVAGKAAEETFWLCGMRGLRVFDALDAVEPNATAKAFADGGYYAVRSGWASDADFLFVNAAPQESGHAHADALAFELAVGGRNLLVDAGTYSYADAEARNYFRSGAAHNALTVDGESASAPDAAKPFRWLASANIEARKWITHDRFAFFAATHDGFSRLPDAGKSEHTREFFVLNDDYTILRDFVGIGGAHRFELNFHFDAKSAPAAEFSAGADFVDERDETGAGLRLQVFGDGGAWESYADSIAPCYGLRLPAPTLIFASEATGSQEFFTFLLPVRAAAKLFEASEISTNGGRGFEIKSERFADRLIYGDGELIRTDDFASNFRFAWARFSAGSGDLEEFVLIGGSRFVFKGKEIVNYPAPLDFVVARRVGKNLKIQADADVFSVNLPRNLTSRTILRTPRKI